MGWINSHVVTTKPITDISFQKEQSLSLYMEAREKIAM